MTFPCIQLRGGETRNSLSDGALSCEPPESFLAPSAVKHRPVEGEHLLNNLRWRYAVKKFDPARQIGSATWSALEHASDSFATEFRAAAVEVRGDRRSGACERSSAGRVGIQSQITGRVKLVVLPANQAWRSRTWTNYIARIPFVRGVSRSLADFHKMITGFASKPGFDTDLWAAKRVYIAAGVFLTSAAMLGIDATDGGIRSGPVTRSRAFFQRPGDHWWQPPATGRRMIRSHLKEVRFSEAEVIVRQL